MRRSPFSGEPLDLDFEWAGGPPPNSRPHRAFHQATLDARRSVLGDQPKLQERGTARPAEDVPPPPNPDVVN